MADEASGVISLVWPLVANPRGLCVLRPQDLTPPLCSQGEDVPFRQLLLPPPPTATCRQTALRLQDLSGGTLASDTQRLATRMSAPATRHFWVSGLHGHLTFPRDEGGFRGATTSLLSAPAPPRGLSRAHFRGPCPAALRPATDGAFLGWGHILRSPEVRVTACLSPPLAPTALPSSDNCKPHSNSRDQACHFKQPGLFKQDNRLR